MKRQKARNCSTRAILFERIRNVSVKSEAFQSCFATYKSRDYGQYCVLFFTMGGQNPRSATDPDMDYISDRRIVWPDRNLPKRHRVAVRHGI